MGVVPADLSAVSWPVRTTRLTIRPSIPADADWTWRFRRLPALDQWLSRWSTTLQQYRTTFTDPDRLSKTLIVELDGALIGDLMLAVNDAWAQSDVQDQACGVQAELGWGLDPDHHGHGYATEAATELLRICCADNTTSQLLMVADLVRSDAGDPTWELRDTEPVMVHWFRLLTPATAGAGCRA